MVRVVVLATLAAVATACSLDSSSFRDSSTLAIGLPQTRAIVDLPTTVAWTEAEVEGVRGYAVFINQAPMPPGKQVEWVARGDDECRRIPGCPDESWLRNHGIYVTDTTSVELTVVPGPQAGARRRSDDGVEVVVVPLDVDGRRLGDSAASRLFYVDRSQ